MRDHCAPGQRRVHRMSSSSLLLIVIFLAVIIAGTASGQTNTPQVDRLSPEAPDAVNQLVLSIEPQQVVGAPLITRSQVFILDEISDLVTVYDLEADPINLTVSSGTLNPSVIDDNALFDAGVVDFLSMGVTFQGASGTVALAAYNSTVTSGNSLVSFSGYDILSVRTAAGNPVTGVFSDLPERVGVAVTNRGGLPPSQVAGQSLCRPRRDLAAEPARAAVGPSMGCARPRLAVHPRSDQLLTP